MYTHTYFPALSAGKAGEQAVPQGPDSGFQRHSPLQGPGLPGERADTGLGREPMGQLGVPQGSNWSENDRM